MWSRAQLKEKAKISFKRNYWKSVLIALILALFVGGGGFSSGVSGGLTSGFNSGIEEDSYTEVDSYTETHILVNGVEETDGELYDEEFSDEELAQMESVAGMVAAAIFIIIFLVIFFVVMAIVIVVDAFVINPFEIGARRFYLQNFKEQAQVKEVGYGFDHNYKNIAKTMFFRDLYTALWSLLFIIPGIVKMYEYRMIPYLLAENPQMTKEQAFATSKQMMRGQKWKAFVLDLSFIGWRILDALTFGILGIFYVNPYYDATEAALYEALK